MAGCAGVQRAGQAAHMVLVGVGADHIVQLVDALLVQIGHHQAAVGHVAAVDEHGILSAHQQGGVGLSHIDEVYGQGGAVRYGGSAARRRGEQVAARQGDEQAEQSEQGGDTSFHGNSFSALVYIMCKHQYKPKRQKRKERCEKMRTAVFREREIKGDSGTYP